MKKFVFIILCVSIKPSPGDSLKEENKTQEIVDSTNVQFSSRGIKSVGDKIFYLRDIKNLTPIGERIHEEINEKGILDNPKEKIIVSDNSFFRDFSPFKEFEILLSSFFSDTLSENKGSEYILDFELLHYNVKVAPDENSLKIRNQGITIAAIGIAIWLVRVLVLEIPLIRKKNKTLDDQTAMVLIPLIAMMPVGDPLWKIVTVIQDIFIIAGILTSESAKNTRNLIGTLEARVKFYDKGGEFLFEKKIKGVYSKKINVQKDLFKGSGFMGLKRKLNISLINDFLKNAKISFLNDLLKEMEGL